MAILTAQGIARVAIPMLNRQLVLPRTFTVAPADGFTGPNGETITVRVRVPHEANEQSTAGASIAYDALDEVGVDVNLKHLYDAIKVTDEDMSLNLEDFASQVTEPQVGALASKAESQIYAGINAVTASPDLEFAATASADDTKATVLAAREALSNVHVPAQGRFLACAPSIITRLLLVDEFVRADASGSTDALRNAIVGRIYGFEVVEAPGLTTDTAFAYHRSSGVWANKKPADPRGAAESAALTVQGISMRQIFNFESRWLSDVSVLSTFAGFSLVYEDADESTPSESTRWVTLGVASSSSS